MDIKDHSKNDQTDAREASEINEVSGTSLDDNRIYDELDARPEKAATSEDSGPAAEPGQASAAEKEVFDEDGDELDLDVSSTVGPYAGDRPPYVSAKKGGGLGNIALGIVVILAGIGLTWYAFRGDQQKPEQETAATISASPAASGGPDTESGQTADSLLPKAPDAADFSPAPEEVQSADNESGSLPATISSSSPKPGVVVAEKIEEAPRPVVPKSKAPENSQTQQKAGTKAEPKKTEPKKPEPAATKTATASNPATAAPKTDSPAATTAPAESQPETADKVEAEGDKTTASPTEAAAEKPAETPVAATPATPAAEGQAGKAMEISDLWVVNISSTPNAAESLRLLTQVMASEREGQVYAYETTLDGTVHHRIRVGFFATRSEAEAVGQRIKEQYKLSATPWAVTPTVDEVKRHKK